MMTQAELNQLEMRKQLEKEDIMRCRAAHMKKSAEAALRQGEQTNGVSRQKWDKLLAEGVGYVISRQERKDWAVTLT